MKLYDISEWCKHGIEITDYPYLGETNVTAAISEVVKIGREYYSIGIISADKSQAGVRKVSYHAKPESRDYEDDLICPYCGYADHDAFELSDDDGETTCGRCGAEIHYTRNVEITYSTDGVKPPKVVNGKWMEAQDGK